MAKGDPQRGLLKAIIDVMKELGADQCYRADYIAAKLKEKNYWGGRMPKTPERTVSTHFTENREIFGASNGAEYFLREGRY